jgi:hypothetical protein
MNKVGLKVDSVNIKKIKNNDTDKKFYFNLLKPSVDDQASIKKCLYIKDKTSMSDKKYEIFRRELNLQEKLAPLSQIKKIRKLLNSEIIIKHIGKGVFIDIKHTIISRIIFYQNKLIVGNDDIIHLRLSADGTNVGKTIKLLNMTFGLINEGLKTTTASGQYSLGIGEIENENYEAIESWFTEIIKELNELKNQLLIINGKEFKLEFYFTAYYKLTLIALGLKSAKSSYPFAWCTTHIDELHLQYQEKSIIDPSKNARSETERYELLHLNTDQNQMGYKHYSLLGDLIPSHRCIVDILHMKLRIIVNVLLQQLSLELIYLDNFKITQTLDKEKHLNIVSYFDFLNKVKIKVGFYANTTKGKTSLHREFNGTEILRFLDTVELKDVYPKDVRTNKTAEELKEEYSIKRKRDNMQELFKMFYIVYLGITSENPYTSSEIREITSVWHALFLQTFHSSKVTPYIHIFVCHLHEFQELYGNVNLFNQQGVEKLNDLITIDYFKSTNKSNKYLTQILQKRTRISNYEMKML